MTNQRHRHRKCGNAGKSRQVCRNLIKATRCQPMREAVNTDCHSRVSEETATPANAMLEATATAGLKFKQASLTTPLPRFLPWSISGTLRRAMRSRFKDGNDHKYRNETRCSIRGSLQETGKQWYTVSKLSESLNCSEKNRGNHRTAEENLAAREYVTKPLRFREASFRQAKLKFNVM